MYSAELRSTLPVHRQRPLRAREAMDKAGFGGGGDGHCDDPATSRFKLHCRFPPLLSSILSDCNLARILARRSSECWVSVSVVGAGSSALVLSLMLLAPRLTQIWRGRVNRCSQPSNSRTATRQ